MFKYFRVSFLMLIMGMVAAYFRGESEVDGSGLSFLFSAIVICALEISVSFDNAVVNAVRLRKMSPKWQRRFLTWGIAIAVFGMRFVFPIAIVAAFSQIAMSEVLNLALKRPDEYARHLHEANVGISSFGGAFLMMLFFEFMFDKSKQVHWISPLERVMKNIGRIKFAALICTLVCIVALQFFLPKEKIIISLCSAIAGLVSHLLIHGASAYLERKAGENSAFAIKHAGLMSFIYLEFIDASFSLDGVLGAFALTKDVIIIAIGLGVGAFFVRSLTILLVEKKALEKLLYLTHGAYWAIGVLAGIMFVSAVDEVPEFVTGTLGLGFILAAFVCSLRLNKKNAEGAA